MYFSRCFKWFIISLETETENQNIMKWRSHFALTLNKLD